MKKFLLAGAAGVALLASGVAMAQGYGGKGMDRDGNGEVTRAEATAASDMMFKRMDVNKDNVLSEADRAARKDMRFAAVDTNNDGQLSKAELETAKAARMDKRAERQEKRAERREQRMANMTEEQKAAWQAKRTERQEARFAKMDTDGNGALSEAEFAAAADMMKGREGRRGGGKAMRGGHHGGQHGGGHEGGGRRGMMMAQADTNGDKAISQDEFRAAALTRFAAMDADNNGVVTKAERQAMREKRGGMRGKRGGDQMMAPAAE